MEVKHSKRTRWVLVVLVRLLLLSSRTPEASRGDAELPVLAHPAELAIVWSIMKTLESVT
jgi:hypothetical protein